MNELYSFIIVPEKGVVLHFSDGWPVGGKKGKRRQRGGMNDREKRDREKRRKEKHRRGCRGEEKYTPVCRVCLYHCFY